MSVQGVIRPWEANPYQLISWWDMETFSAHIFFAIGKLIKEAQFGLVQGEGDRAYAILSSVSEEKKANLRGLVQSVRAHCESIGLRISVTGCDRLTQALATGDKVTIGVALGEVERRIQDEMAANLFMYFPPASADRYNEPLKGWEEVAQRFPKTKPDIEECSRCFSCDRYGAAIFHVLLVAEFGVIELAKLLKVEGDRPGWGALERLERILEKDYKARSSLEQQYSKVLEQHVPLMLAIKDSWRHKISHVENRLEWLDTTFSPNIAEEIISATRGFMRRLAGEET